ncbi:MAG: site-specific integrase [Myxococcaceae bacterium]
MTKRRGRGEGAIFLHPKGLWCASLTIGYDEKGIRKRRYVYGKTKKEVQNKLIEMHSASASGTLVNPKRMRLAEYLKHWLEDIMRTSIRPTTFVLYEALIRLHINPHLGGIILNSLNAAQIQHLYRELENNKASLRTQAKTYAILRKSLGQANRLGYIQQNPCLLVQKPRYIRKPIHFWNNEQVRHFLKIAETDRLYPLYILALTTGMRLGELLALQWQDVDLTTGSVSVQRIAYEINGKISLGEPKTAKGRRKIELPNITMDALKIHRNKMASETDSVLLFCDTHGSYLRQSNLRRRSFEPLIVKSGLPKIRFHDLRHTAATLLLSKGIHPKVVQERLGHAQISMTLDVYSHVLPSMQKEAAAQLETLLK